jgi:hypothetical protein
MTDELHKRGRALEEAFFTKQNEELLAKLRAQEAVARKKQELAVATGIKDATLLEALAIDGVEPNALTALTLAPIVLMAWRKGVVQPAERNAVLRAAEERGIQPGSPQWKLIEGWLDTRPHATLQPAWVAYVKALREKLPPADFAALRADFLARAREVAHAAGWMHGVGVMSHDLRAFISELEAALA